MAERYRFHDGGLFFMTMTVVGWIDVFTRKEYADLLIQNLNFCIDNKGLEVFEFCVMPSHVHLICSSQEHYIGAIIKDFKSFTAKELLKLIAENREESRREWLLYMFRYFAKGTNSKSEFQFWQHGNHPISLESTGLIQQKQEYIWNNPVKAGIVTEPHAYFYSSANPATQLKISI